MNIFEDFCYTFVSKCTRYLRSERTQLSKMTQEMLKINDSRIFLLYSKDISGTFCVSWGFFLSIKIVTFLTNVIQLLLFHTANQSVHKPSGLYTISYTGTKYYIG